MTAVQAYSLDLVILAPGKDERETFDGLLSSRQESLGIQPVRYEILTHPRRDPGCFHEAPDILQPYVNIARYSLVVLDYEGSGQEDRSPGEVAEDVKARLDALGWQNRSAVLVIEPELENWVWSDSPEVDRSLGWEGRNPPLRQWLQQNALWQVGNAKPNQPKEALQAALREVRMRRSSSIYRQLAERVSLLRCQDEAFDRFKEILGSWFGS